MDINWRIRGVYARRGIMAAVLVVSISLLSGPGGCTEVNDLWLLISSYEDIGITVHDLAFFLATHGFNANPERGYVTVTFSDGEKAYLTPNGAAPRLADLWAEPPTPTGPVRVIVPDAIQRGVIYERTENSRFIREVTRRAIFPVTPLGMCYDGSKKLADTYESFNYRVRYMYDPSEWDWQGHLWVIVEDDGRPDRWIAVDSYYGVMIDDEYYSAPYSFEGFENLDSINPKWRLG